MAYKKKRRTIHVADQKDQVHKVKGNIPVLPGPTCDDAGHFVIFCGILDLAACTAIEIIAVSQPTMLVEPGPSNVSVHSNLKHCLQVAFLLLSQMRKDV